MKEALIRLKLGEDPTGARAHDSKTQTLWTEAA